MSESFLKKEKAKQKAKLKQDKALKMKERKLNNNKGKGLDDMMAYIDENGNLSTTPPDKVFGADTHADDIILGARPIEETEPEVYTGTITHFNAEKNYGFISEDHSGNNLFFHGSNCNITPSLNLKVTFDKERTPKGENAVNVSKA